jgi:hypothetical protein
VGLVDGGCRCPFGDHEVLAPVGHAERCGPVRDVASRPKRRDFVSEVWQQFVATTRLRTVGRKR